MKLFGPTLCLSFLACLIVFSSCETDLEFVTGDEVQLSFSTDTIMFDTVFTERGSATQIMKVYNESSDAIKIDRIAVQGTMGVRYNFNVDGFQGPEAEDVVIFGNDSIFVFVEVLIDPTEPENISPFIAEDKLVFETGNTREDVVLMAFGQNANYLNRFNRGQFAGFPDCNNGIFVLPQDLPTVIFGSIVINDCTLRALEGTKIYFHGGVQRNEDFAGNGFFNDGILFAQETGKIELLGTLDKPVVISTDRLEARFRDDPAKYRGIILGAGSRGNRIEHTMILNSIVGVQVDSLAEVEIDNSIIAFSGGPAITGYQSDITVRNSVCHSNFGNSVQIIKGGNVQMDHVTLANYGVDAQALVLRNFACLDDECMFPIAANLSVGIRNSIIVGSSNNEIQLLDIFGGDDPTAFQLQIDNSVVKTNDDLLQSQMGLFADFFERNCRNCINTTFQDELFRSIDQDDYRLDSLGVARNLGVFLPELPEDINGTQRKVDSTDAGAYQFFPGE